MPRIVKEFNDLVKDATVINAGYTVEDRDTAVPIIVLRTKDGRQVVLSAWSDDEQNSVGTIYAYLPTEGKTGGTLCQTTPKTR